MRLPEASPLPLSEFVTHRDTNSLSDPGLAFARRALAGAGGDVGLLDAVEVEPTGAGVAAALAAGDGREGAETIWRAAAATAIGLHRALLAAAIGRGTSARLDPAQALYACFGHAAEHLADARDGVLVTTAAEGSLAVQAPTPVHRELAGACAGGSAAEAWRAGVRAWAAGRSAAAAAAELQDWGVPAFALGQAAARPDPLPAVSPGRASWSPPAGGAGPLRGVRVVEMGGLWAAPYAASLLGELGAEVTKVEAPSRPDGARRGPFARFAALNAGKRFRALDLRGGAERDALLGLLAPGTVLIENFSGRVLGNLGIPPAEILRRGAVLVRLPASRAEPDRRGLGSTIELAAGLGRRGGDGALTCAPLPFTDALAGLQAALAAVAALRWGRRLRPIGQLEDVAAGLAPAGALAAIEAGERSGRGRRRLVSVAGREASVPATPWRIGR